MSPVARSRQAHSFSTEKKKKKIYKESENPTITSLADKSNRWQRKHTPVPDTAYRANQPQQQTKLNSKPNTEHTKRNTENTERQRFLSRKKKNRQYTNKNQTPANPRSRRRDAAARSSSPSSLTPHRRSEIGLCFGARSEICRRQTVDRSSLIGDLPLTRCFLRSGSDSPALPQGFFFSLSLSLSL